MTLRGVTTPVAEEDLWRIYQWGFRRHGEAAANAYYAAFFDRFEQIAEINRDGGIKKLSAGTFNYGTRRVEWLFL